MFRALVKGAPPAGLFPGGYLYVRLTRHYEVALLYTNCFTALLESKKESWNSMILVLGGGLVLNPFLEKSN